MLISRFHPLHPFLLPLGTQFQDCLSVISPDQFHTLASIEMTGLQLGYYVNLARPWLLHDYYYSIKVG